MTTMKHIGTMERNILNKSYVTPNSFTNYDSLSHLENKENHIVFRTVN